MTGQDFLSLGDVSGERGEKNFLVPEEEGEDETVFSRTKPFLNTV